MLDPYLFRTELDFVKQQLQRRNFAFDGAAYEALEAQRKATQVKTQQLQSERNSRSKHRTGQSQR
jgi:seryl-tRNA synthetase